MICLLFLPVMVRAEGPLKKCSSYFTEIKVRNAAENIQKYAWARKEKDNIVKRADKWLDDYHNDYGSLWSMIPSQEVPRAYAVHSLEGCLVCGTAINKYGNYSYLYNKNKVDWKLTCPNCHLTFPTNDFKAYYEGGLERDGTFNFEKARRHNDALLRKGEKGNLINLYTIKGLTTKQLKDLKAAGASDSTIQRITTDSQWGVDGGMGYCFNPSDKEKYGDPYTYVAYYAHWALWYERIVPMLHDFSMACMLTRYSNNSEERKKSQVYADAAIVMLDRIADLYPQLYVSAFPRNGYFGFPNNGFKWHTNISAGRIVGSIWENGLIKDIMFAYDAIFPYINGISAKARKILVKKSGKAYKGNSQRIKINFEKGVLEEVAKAFTNGDLQGNPGMQQSSLALAAVVMDHNPETLQWLNIVYKNGNSDWNNKEKRDGGSTLRYIVNRISRDGQGDEVSIAYNAGWLANWSVVAKILDGYKIPERKMLNGGIDFNLYHNPRFEKLFKTNYPYLLTDYFVPHIGDTALTGAPGFAGNPDYAILNPDNVILAYEKYKTVELAQAVFMLKNGELNDVHADIFTKTPEAIKKEIKKVIDRYGEFHLHSNNFTAYGLGILRDGNTKNSRSKTTQRALWMFYGARSASHNHADPLNLGYIGYDMDLMPDFGYPNTLGGDLNPEQQWDKSTPAHNTVSFDDLGYRGHIVCYGKPLHFDDSKEIQFMHVSADGVQNSNIRYAKRYERTTALIRIDDKDSYIADFFFVNSPRHYSYNFHTAEVDALSTKYENVSFDPVSTVTYNKHTLRDVRSATINNDRFGIDWNILDTWNRYSKGIRAKTNIHLKITMLGNYKKIQVGEAVPPTNNSNNPLWVPILQVPSTGTTLFTSIIEPYNTNSKIISSNLVPVTVNGCIADSTTIRAVRIKLANGRTDYIVNALNREKTYRIDDKFDFCGFLGVYSQNASGHYILKYVNDGTSIGGSVCKNRITGIVTDATNKLSNINYITIKTDERIDVDQLKGNYIYINNDDIKDTPFLLKYNAVYPIESVVLQSDHIYRLNLGDCSVIRGWKDMDDYDAGYERDFSIGSHFYIPLTFKGSN
ncbi:MAG: hypothetical protein GX416_13515 [Bacteroidales bacterium]|nr:hypothetical protein [Bacteroidales bacterium]